VDGIFGGDDTFVVQVDSVEVPSSVRPGDTLSIRLFGTIGPNRCHWFKRFEADRGASTLRLKVLGVDAGGEVCAQALTMLDTTYKVSPPLEGPVFTIAIEQPDGSLLRDSVEVVEG
jgi:hypothetical protein